MIISLVVILATLGFSSAAPSLANCIPDKTKLYWQTPCDGQSYKNLITLKKLTFTQNGKDVDSNGGFDFSSPIVASVEFENSHGKIQNPLADVHLRVYDKLLVGSCKWIDIPTFGKGNNLNPCKDLPKQCHLENGETSLTVDVDPKKLGAALALVKVGTYYSISISLKDGSKPLTCVYGQEKVFKK